MIFLVDQASERPGELTFVKRRAYQKIWNQGSIAFAPQEQHLQELWQWGLSPFDKKGMVADTTRGMVADTQQHGGRYNARHGGRYNRARWQIHKSTVADITFSWSYSYRHLFTEWLTTLYILSKVSNCRRVDVPAQAVLSSGCKPLIFYQFQSHKWSRAFLGTHSFRCRIPNFVSIHTHIYIYTYIYIYIYIYKNRLNVNFERYKLATSWPQDGPW